MNHMKDIFRDFQPSGMQETDAERAAMISASLKYRRELIKFNGYLPFPQGCTTFTFSRFSRNLTIGALFILWDCGEPFVCKCPSCGGALHAFGFGGFFFKCGISSVCIQCAKRFYRPIVRNISYLREILGEPLEGTAFFVRRMEIGEIFSGHRKSLWQVLKLLGADSLPSQDWATGLEPPAIISRRDTDRKWIVQTFLEITPPKTVKSAETDKKETDDSSGK